MPGSLDQWTVSQAVSFLVTGWTVLKGVWLFCTLYNRNSKDTPEAAENHYSHDWCCAPVMTTPDSLHWLWKAALQPRQALGNSTCLCTLQLFSLRPEREHFPWRPSRRPVIGTNTLLHLCRWLCHDWCEYPCHTSPSDYISRHFSSQQEDTLLHTTLVLQHYAQWKASLEWPFLPTFDPFH
jgi:hypothetical protein